jgi:hypothetical protein
MLGNKLVLVIEYWNLFGIWSLGLGILETKENPER